MKHVLVLNQFALPRDQGGGTRHIDLFARLDGWTFQIVAGNRNHYTQQPFTTSDRRFRLVSVPSQDGTAAKRVASWLAYCGAAARIALTTRRVDAIYASSPHLLVPLAGWALSRIRRVSFILEIRDLWPESFVAAGLLQDGSALHRVLKLLERFVVSRADQIVVVTDGWQDHLGGIGANLATVTVIPNGTDANDFRLPNFDRELSRRQLGITGTTAVFAGAHGPKDGIDLILDAASQLPDLNFLLVGDGQTKSQATKRAEVENLANVEFRNPVPKKQLPRLLRSCDIGIHSVAPLSVFALGMSPNKLFDYLAAGLPVVSNGGAPVARIMAPHVTGSVGGSDHLVDGLRAVAQASTQEKEHWRSNSEMLINTRFSRTSSASRLETVLERKRCRNVNSDAV